MHCCQEKRLGSLGGNQIIWKLSNKEKICKNLASSRVSAENKEKKDIFETDWPW